MFLTSADIEAELNSAGLEAADAGAIAQISRPGVWLETRAAEDSDIPIGATKIGGRPDLPDGVDWPTRPLYHDADARAARYREDAERPDSWWKKGSTKERRDAYRAKAARLMQIVSNPAPLSFIAQFNFEEIWAAGPIDPDMPKTGLLSLFYDLQEQPWGFGPKERIGFAALFSDTPLRALTRRDPPPSIDAGLSLTPLSCEPRPCVTPPPLGCRAYDALKLSEDAGDAYNEWSIGLNEDAGWSGCRLGGWPNEIQGDMQIQCALIAAGHNCGTPDAYRDPALADVRARADEWLMLAQIGSDDAANMMWGDAGKIYLWIRRDDLVARRFEAAHLILQCF